MYCRARFQVGRSAEGEHRLRREDDTRGKPAKDKGFDGSTRGEDKENLVKKERGCKNSKENRKDDSCCKYSIQTNPRDDERGDNHNDIGNRGIGDAESELGQVAYEGLARRNKR